MPLYKVIKHNENTQILVWHIIESEEKLQNITLNANSLSRLKHMKSESHRKGFLAVRQLLKYINLSDNDLYYTPNGKPHLTNGKTISITHSFEFSVIAISSDDIGVDIEQQRDKIKVIAPKFFDGNLDFIDKHFAVEYLTIVWGAKESLFKIYPSSRLSFKTHLSVQPFAIEDKTTQGWIKKDDFHQKYTLYFESFKGYTLVYAIKN